MALWNPVSMKPVAIVAGQNTLKAGGCLLKVSGYPVVDTGSAGGDGHPIAEVLQPTDRLLHDFGSDRGRHGRPARVLGRVGRS